MSFLYSAPNLWNKIPVTVRECTISTFNKLKHLIRLIVRHPRTNRSQSHGDYCASVSYTGDGRNCKQ